MNEKVAQTVMSLYLKELWGVKLSPKAVGADFRHKGNAIEVKGSGLRVSQAINQFSRYATEFNDFGIAFPFDALNATNLFHLHVLGTIWYPAFSKFLSVYLIFRDADAGRYGVLRISDASNLLRMIFDVLKKTYRWEEKEITKLLEKTEYFIKSLDPLIQRGAVSMIMSDSRTTWLFACMHAYPIRCELSHFPYFFVVYVPVTTITILSDSLFFSILRVHGEITGFASITSSIGFTWTLCESSLILPFVSIISIWHRPLCNILADKARFPF